MMYDHITDQFNKDLSPLAKRMYAGLVDIVSRPSGPTFIEDWPTTDEGTIARQELIDCGLVSEVRPPRAVKRFSLTSAAWRAHLHAAQEKQ